MFSRAAKDGETADPSHSAPRKLAMASLVAEGVRIKGDFATEGDLHLDGTLEGDLSVGQLTVGETGALNGAVQADSVEIRGRVTGTITARRVRLWATARVDGDISHGELAIEAGARFVGQSLALTAEPAPLSVVAAE
jgi:cytoskeletal protein CcmA (bactofilin family)